MSDDIVVSIGGQDYTKWSEIKISRGLDEVASDFDVSVTEKWAGIGSPVTPWQIKRFDSCTIMIGGQLVLTGFVEHYEPSIEGNSHTVRVAGRSKTCDLVDCMPDITPGFYNGSKLDAIARGVAAQFGIDVVVDDGVDVGAPFGTVAVEKTETAHALIEKLARMRAIVLTDNEKGNLVLTQTSNKNAAGSLIEGENILAGSAKIAGNEMFSKYVVYSQTPDMEDADGRPDVAATATDPNVPRFRRFAEVAENPADGEDDPDKAAFARAHWRAIHQSGISTEATITVYGYRQTPGGDLWAINLNTYVKSPRLALAGTMLIGKVTWSRDNTAGSRTEMLLAPPGAFTPEPDPKINNSDQAYGAVNKIPAGT